MRIILFLLFFFISINAQEIALDNLLKRYEKSESLYKKTKKESAGFLLVYSREDLEKMQAYTLRDVMKTVRMYTTQINKLGALRSVKLTSGIKSVPPIKLYIDDYEVNSVLQVNALDVYGDMNLYFVDHIEIYQGGSSIAFGNEPGSMVIRLYSKDPLRENSTSVEFSVDSKAGGDLSVVDAGGIGDYKYLFYADAAKTNYDTYKRNSKELSRDGRRYQTHFKISQENNFKVDLDVISIKSDIFNGFGSAPLGDYNSRSYGYIDAIKYFDGNWKISLSASREQKEVENDDVNGIKLSNNLMSNHFDTNVISHTYKAIVEKKIISGNSDFLIGTQFQQKNFDTKSYNIENMTPDFDSGKLDIYMFYIEELYNINKNNLITFSGKVDYYSPNFTKDSTEYSVRLGYISLLSKDIKTKIFGIRRYTYPAMLQSAWAPPVYKPNNDLKSSTINMLAGELEYNDNIHRLLFGYAYKVIDDSIGFNQISKMYVNKKDTVYFNRFYIRGEHHFDFDNKAVIEYYKGYKDVDYSPDSGVLVQLFNKIWNFNIYNELVYRQGYSINNIKIDDGYDYTLSVGYPVNRDLNVKLKGENLFDSASETLIDNQGLIKVPAIEQRVTATVEYTF
jgi:iron complex outermembrane receptor protein